LKRIADALLTCTADVAYGGFCRLKSYNFCAFQEVASMPKTDKRKQSLYFPEDMLQEITAEAARQDRSLSWIVQKAWKIARKDIMKYPSVNEPEETGGK